MAAPHTGSLAAMLVGVAGTARAAVRTAAARRSASGHGHGQASTVAAADAVAARRGRAASAAARVREGKARVGPLRALLGAKPSAARAEAGPSRASGVAPTRPPVRAGVAPQMTTMAGPLRSVMITVSEESYLHAPCPVFGSLCAAHGANKDAFSSAFSRSDLATALPRTRAHRCVRLLSQPFQRHTCICDNSVGAY